MLSKELLKEIIVSQKERFLEEELYPRFKIGHLYKSFQSLDEIFCFIGIRRCGKSSFMRLILKELMDQDEINEQQFLYFNFEDERLTDFSVENFNQLLEAFYEINDLKPGNKKIYLFLYEIQNIKFWEKWIRRIYEEKKYKIFITGSNANLLSSEISSSLTGRNIPIRLFPFSFYEFLSLYKGFKLDENSFYKLEEKTQINKYLEEYLEHGGMPQYMISQDRRVIEACFQDILYRDIVFRYGIRNVNDLRRLCHFLLSNISRLMSLENIKKTLQMRNISTVKNYMDYLEKVLLFYRLPKFDFSVKKQIYNPDKIYVADISFYNVLAFKSRGNIGFVYENLVFNELQRQEEYDIYYYKTKRDHEVDFILVDKKSVLPTKQINCQLIQVSYDISKPETLERERKSLVEAMEELDLKESYLINNEIDKEETIEGETQRIIRYIPLAKWLTQRYLANSKN